MGARMWRGAAVGFAVVTLAGVFVVLRAYFASRSAWEDGERLVAEYNRLGARAGKPQRAVGDGERRAELLRGAIVSYREAAMWYLPGAPYGRRAAARLITIGQRAEESRDDALALFAYRAARTSILAVRSVFLPGEPTLDQADRAIARVSARAPVRPSAGGETESYPERERRHLALLEPGAPPDPWLSLLAAAGLLAWIGGASGFALRGIDPAGRIRRRAAAKAAVVVIAGLTAWITGLATA